MSVYDLNREGLRKTFYEFHKTLYGRTVFFFAYFIPFILFITAAIAALFAIFYSFDIALLNLAIACILSFVPTFIIGNMYFYSEVRKFCAHEDRRTRRASRKK
ncbi:hypothetical protein J5500_03350 [Candidatus Saccharibacteria bacterium]|nr:hypothetical protein [Candidatus Saccharibacteria bacterium]